MISFGNGCPTTGILPRTCLPTKRCTVLPLFFFYINYLSLSNKLAEPLAAENSKSLLLYCFCGSGAQAVLPWVFWLQVSHRLQAHGKAQPREAPLPSSFTRPRVLAACWPEASLGFFSPVHRPAHGIAAGFHQNQREGKSEITVLLSPNLTGGIHHFGHILFIRSKPFVLAHTPVEAITQG